MYSAIATLQPGVMNLMVEGSCILHLGHSKEDYSNATYLAHILEGLKWVTDKPKPDYKKAKATSSVIDEMKYF